jgi:hypothetical protein
MCSFGCGMCSAFIDVHRVRSSVGNGLAQVSIPENEQEKSPVVLGFLALGFKRQSEPAVDIMNCTNPAMVVAVLSLFDKSWM